MGLNAKSLPHLTYTEIFKLLCPPQTAPASGVTGLPVTVAASSGPALRLAGLQATSGHTDWRSNREPAAIGTAPQVQSSGIK